MRVVQVNRTPATIKYFPPLPPSSCLHRPVHCGPIRPSDQLEELREFRGTEGLRLWWLGMVVWQRELEF